MGACDFSAVFSEICNNIMCGEAISQMEIYSRLFSTYFESHDDEYFALDKSDINRRKQGKMNAHAGIISFYCQDQVSLCYDIETNIVPLIGDKYALRDTLINMVKCDSCSEEKKADTLADTSDIPAFFAKVVIHSFGHISVQKTESPNISDRIIMTVPKPCKTFSGRQNELRALSEMLEAHDKVFLYGIGGIGKSEFVKAYAAEHKRDFKNIIYATYSENIRTTIASIPFKSDKQADTLDELFSSHFDYLRILKSDTLIIIDNFDILPETDNDLDNIMELQAKIVFTTRNNFGDDYDTFELTDVDRITLFEIAEKMKLTDIDHDTLNKIFEAVHDHTLACELIIRLLKKSAHNPSDILRMLTTDHVNISASDKIRKDKTSDAVKYSEHIHKLFRLFALSDEQQRIMCLLSLIPVAGISDMYFQVLTGIENLDTINELEEIGLVRYEDHLITVHPLIGEAAAFDLAPDMDKCRGFIDNLNLEFQHHLATPMNYMRQEVILEIADRIVTFADKNDVDAYFYFLINACPYAEVFEDKHRMGSYISEMERYMDKAFDNLSRAVYYMNKAAYTALFDNDSDAAIEYETSAISLLPDYPKTPREKLLCFNIYNSLGGFFTMKNDIYHANLCFQRAVAFHDPSVIPEDDFLILKNNLIALEEKKFQMIMEMESGELKNIKENP